MAMVIYGKNPIQAAIAAKRKFYEVYVLNKEEAEWVKSTLGQDVKIKVLDKGKMNQLLATTAHQGIGALVEDYALISLKEALKKPGKKLYLMLDSLEDPHNLGAIIRSADAFDISGVIIPKNRSVSVTPTVVKVSTGAIEHVDIIGVGNLNQAIQELKKNNVWVVGLDMDTDKTLEDVHVDTDLCLVLGSEGKGVARLVKENCDYLVKIPMHGHVNSLNVSVSAGIALYDITRRRG